MKLHEIYVYSENLASSSCRVGKHVFSFVFYSILQCANSSYSLLCSGCILVCFGWCMLYHIDKILMLSVLPMLWH